MKISKQKPFFPEVREDTEVEKFYEENYNPLVSDLQRLLGNLSIYDNTDSFLLENITIEPSSSKKFVNYLRVVPSYRLIVKQTSGGVLLDGNWTDKIVEFKNDSATIFKGSILLLKG